MYKFERNTKILCIFLMIIGAISLLYGFISADKKSYSDKEIKKIVKELYKEKSIEKEDVYSHKKDQYGSYLELYYHFHHL